MKKYYLTAALIVALAGSMTLSSCIGSFALTNKVLSWNNQVGNKFVNELVFFAFWILPVYEVTSLADLLVINTIEFWSGTNPMTASTKAIDTDHGRYLVKCDGKGYDVECPDGNTLRLNFYEDSQTWTVKGSAEDSVETPFLTFVDENHVKMYSPDGMTMPVELSPAGVLAYQTNVASPVMAAR